MRYLISLLAVLILALPARAVESGRLFTGVVVTNPVINAVMADSGVLDPTLAIWNGNAACDTGGIWHVHATMSTTVAGFFKIVVLDATTPTPVAINTMFRGLLANDTKDYAPDISFRVPNGGRIQVQNDAAKTGNVQGSLLIAFNGCY